MILIVFITSFFLVMSVLNINFLLIISFLYLLFNMFLSSISIKIGIPLMNRTMSIDKSELNGEK